MNLRLAGCLSVVMMTALSSAFGADVESPAGLFIEGYPDQISVVAGDPLKLRTSSSAAVYSIEIARIGLARE
ncbi:MAG: hypothetical protein ACK50J_14795, partial [Planctomyces sp.]